MIELIKRFFASFKKSSSTRIAETSAGAELPISTTWEDAPWMRWMELHLGEVELTGSTPTAFEREIFTHTNFGGLGASMEPGCAATACTALEVSGYASPHNASAISFKEYGTACELKPGCICVFEWKPGEHHVSFCYVDGEKMSMFLGGNQNHHLQKSMYENKFLIATRWPVKA